MIRFSTAALAAALLGASAPVFACSSCGCNLTSDWLSQGLISQPGTTFSLRYDYVPQTQLRAETGTVDRSAISFPAGREIEQHTYNSYVTASLDHAFNAKWAINVSVPYAIKPHSTIAAGDTNESFSRTEGLGDIRIIGRYQGFSGKGITGIQFGLKLPTGGISQNFSSGPSAGQTVDPGLQVGTGTTNLLIGAYHLGRLSRTFDYVLQISGDIPVNQRALYRPGSAMTASVGLHYTGWKRVIPQLQLNYRLAAADSGANADPANAGGQQLYVAPGVTFALTPRISSFSIVQLPLYERMTGYQLAPKYTLSAGITYKL